MDKRRDYGFLITQHAHYRRNLPLNLRGRDPATVTLESALCAPRNTSSRLVFVFSRTFAMQIEQFRPNFLLYLPPQICGG
jgi:hypothetical protein